MTKKLYSEFHKFEADLFSQASPLIEQSQSKTILFPQIAASTKMSHFKLVTIPTFHCWEA